MVRLPRTLLELLAETPVPGLAFCRACSPSCRSRRPATAPEALYQAAALMTRADQFAAENLHLAGRLDQHPRRPRTIRNLDPLQRHHDLLSRPRADDDRLSSRPAQAQPHALGSRPAVLRLEKQRRRADEKGSTARAATVPESVDYVGAVAADRFTVDDIHPT